MSVLLQGDELQAALDAFIHFLAMRANAKRSTMEQKVRDARLLLVMERVRVALDTQAKDAVGQVALHSPETEGGA